MRSRVKGENSRLPSYDHYLLLLQINSSVFPVGTYAHSFGLETYINEGKVESKEDCLSYLKSYLMNNFLYTDLLSMRIAYNHSTENKINLISNLDELLFASKVPSQIKNASTLLGDSFIRAINNLDLTFDRPIYTDYCLYISENNLKTNFSVIYGVLCAAMNIDLRFGVKNYTYSMVESLVAICVKAIPIGQKAGQYITNKLFDTINEVSHQVFNVSEDMLCVGMPAFDLASMKHEHAYHRIYMS